LPLRNQTELDELLREIYDPQNPGYHKYLSVEEFTKKFGPSEADYAVLQNFARSNSLEIIDAPANRMVLDVEAPASTIEAAFHLSLIHI